MKKLIIAIICGAGLLAVSQSAWAYTATEGSLIKTSNNPAVYYIDDSGYRHLFPNQAVFFSWYKGSWSDQYITVVTANELLQIPAGKNVTVKPGYALIHFDNSLRMYAVLPGGRLCRAPAHYNNYQYNRALILPAGFESDYDNDGSCDITENQKLPDGTLLRYAGSNEVYYIQNSQKRHVTEAGFNANNFRWDSVIENVSASMYYPDGGTISSREDNIYSINYNLGSNYRNSYNYSCSENWTCYAWSACSNGSQHRNCLDSNSCGTTYNKPATSQACYTCNENWTCSSWSSCSYGKQYRTCWDNNSCGTTVSKPVTSQTCHTCNESWTCNSWSTCSSNNQYRNCWDNNSCGTTYNKPATSQTCYSCNESWSCTSWSVCSNGVKYRECLDTNRCGTTAGKPLESQTCY
ncbi:MAG: hypothetical protein WCT16_02885 [Candidatus Buchananbacteria bacterium]